MAINFTAPSRIDLLRKDLYTDYSSHDEWFQVPHPELKTYQRRPRRPLLTPSPAAKLAEARARARWEEEHRQYLARADVKEAAAKQRKRTRGKSLGKPQRILIASSPSLPSAAEAAPSTSVATAEGARLDVASSSVSISTSSSRANDSEVTRAPTTASSSSSSSRNTVAHSGKGAREFATPARSQRKRRYFKKVARSPLAETQNRDENIPDVPQHHSRAHVSTEATHASSASSNAFKVPTSSSSSSSSSSNSSAIARPVVTASSSSGPSAMAHMLPTSSAASSSSSARDRSHAQPRRSPLPSSKDGRDSAAAAASAAAPLLTEHASGGSAWPTAAVAAASRSIEYGVDGRTPSSATTAAPPRSPESASAASSRMANKRASQWGPPQRVLLSELPRDTAGDQTMQNPEVEPEDVSHSQPSPALRDNEHAARSPTRSSPSRPMPSAESLHAQRELPLPNLVTCSSPPPKLPADEEARGATSPDTSSARPSPSDEPRHAQYGLVLKNLISDLEKDGEDLDSVNVDSSGRTDSKSKKPVPRDKERVKTKDLKKKRASVWERLAHGPSDQSKTQNVKGNNALKQRKSAHSRRHTTASGLLKRKAHAAAAAAVSTKRKRDPSPSPPPPPRDDDTLESSEGVDTATTTQQQQQQSELTTAKKRRKTHALVAAQRRDERVAAAAAGGAAGGGKVSAASSVAKKRRQTHKASGGTTRGGEGRTEMSEAQKKSERLKRSREYSNAVSEMRKRRKTTAPNASSSSSSSSSSIPAPAASTSASSGAASTSTAAAAPSSTADEPKKPAPLFAPKSDTQTHSRRGAAAAAVRKRRCTTVPAAGITTTRAPPATSAGPRDVTSAVTRSTRSRRATRNPNPTPTSTSASGAAVGRSQSRARAPTAASSQKTHADSKPSRFRVLEDRSSRSRSTARSVAKRSRLGRAKTAVTVTTSKKPRATRPRSALGSIDGNSQNSLNSAAGGLAKKSYRLVTESDDSSLNKGIGGVQLDFSKDFRAKSRRRKTGAGTKTSLRRSTRLRTRRGQSGSESSLSALPLSVPRDPTTSSKTKASSQTPSLAEKVARGDSLDSLELDNADKNSEAGAAQSADAQSVASTRSGGPNSSLSVRSTRTSKKRPSTSASVRLGAAAAGGTKNASIASARRSASRSRAASRGRADRSPSRARSRALRSGSTAKKKKSVAAKSAATSGGHESDGSESSGGGSDAELQAILDAHNRRVRKFDYVPRQHSRKDYAEWEKNTGKQWHELTAVERTDLNHLIQERKRTK